MKRVADVPLEVLAFKGNLYSTLDFCPPDAEDFLNKSKNYHPLRPGWVLASDSDELRAVVKGHKWGGADWLLTHAPKFGRARAYSLRGEEDRPGCVIDYMKSEQGLYKGMPTLGYTRVLIHSKEKAGGPSGAREQSYALDMNSSLLKRRRFTDFLITCGGHEFPCHRAVLAEASGVFEAAMSGGMAEAQSGCLQIQDAEPEAVSAMLSFMYTGRLAGGDDVGTFRLATLGDRYGLDKLVAACSPALLETLSPDTVGPIARLLRAGAGNPLLRPFYTALQDAVRQKPDLLEAVIKSI